ncbi:aldehyde dehydrogenase [Pedobacter psychrophilus]|uniref:Aldehyde dehydrogenase n=1 Tax=Pedobacter psychrophilus TaxID=1826909 RepID=A0A179DFM5_9SPHI|nr:PA2169 family four-helix-bundle protein [Pedobacter psychrophilus]OAQ39821.1 aldehyde dehydrogenase [Pedobacter psychrophilus]
MSTDNTSTEILNDLVKINNDRIEGYTNAIENLEAKDGDLKSLFIAMIDESRKCKMALSNELNVLKADTDPGTTNSGKLYRVWMDVKAAFTGHDRKSVLENCEFGEDAAQTAYKTASEDEDLPNHLRVLVLEQKSILKQSHDKIKALRDQQVS